MSTPLLAEPSIVIQVEENLQEVGKSAAEMVIREINLARRDQKKITLLLPTGSTPVSMYSYLTKQFYEGKVDFSKVRFYNLDEYVGLGQDHENSYAFYMNNHFYKLVTTGISPQKLTFWGLKPLTKRDCFNKKNRERLNLSLEKFRQQLVHACNENPNSLEAFDSTIESLKKSDRVFQKLNAECMNDRILPSLQSLRAWIQKDTSLKALSASKKNIFLLDGLAKDLNEEVELYQKSLKSCLDDTNNTVVCVGGIGVKPAHIAFNEFTSEDIFLNQMLTEAEKNTQAIKSQTRLVPLTTETREINARFFERDVSKVPQHAITVGLKEILECDKVIILASGFQKRKALYNTFALEPSYNIPSSLLKKHNRSKLHFIVDEKAFGLGEESSLFSLNALNQLQDERMQISCITDQTPKISFWNIPNQAKPVLLDKGYKIANKEVILANLPKKQTVLWIKQNKIHYSLWQELKENKNKIHVTLKQDPQTILSLVEKYQPDMIIMPHTYKLVENFSDLKKEISKKFPNKPLLAAFYDIGPQLNNVFFPMEREEHKNKTAIVQKFHHTQVARAKYDLISEEMSLVSSELSPFNETYSFFNLKIDKRKLRLTPFKQKTYIARPENKNKKQEKLNMFAFKQNDVAIIVSPHPDDAEMSMGGLIQFLGKLNISTHVFNATSGHNALIKKSHALAHPYLPDDIIQQVKCENSEFIESKALKSRIRECESLGALSLLNTDIHVQQLRLPFYSQESKRICNTDRQVADDAIARALCHEKDERIFFFLPYQQDSQKIHRDVHKLFMERITHFCKNNPGKEVIIALYPTPWTGEWNLYDYSYNQGSKLAALCGAELLVGSGKTNAKPESLGGVFANRYFLFYINK